MKLEFVKVILNLLFNLIVELVEKASKNAEDADKQRELCNKDIDLAKNIRQSYPGLSDNEILKQIC